jgi:hypothetical protein
MRAIVPLPSFSGVGAGQTAVVNVPFGNITYHKLQLEFGCTNASYGNQANTESYVTGIRLKINGKTQRTMSAKQLNSINAYFGRSFQARGVGAALLGYLEIFLSEPWRRTPQAEDALAWGTNNIASFTIEVDLAAGVTGPTLNGRAVVEYVSRPIGIISKWYAGQQPVTATGLVVNNTLNKNAGAFQQIHCFLTATTDVTSVDVKTDQIDRYNGTLYEIQEMLSSEGYVPQTNMMHIHFDCTGRLTDALPMNYLDAKGKPTGPQYGNFEIDFLMNAANPFTYLAAVLGNAD